MYSIKILHLSMRSGNAERKKMCGNLETRTKKTHFSSDLFKNTRMWRTRK